MSIKKDFSNLLYQARKEKKLTQEQAAELCKISTRHYQDIEIGRVNPKLTTAVRLASVLEISLNELKPGNTNQPDCYLYLVTVENRKSSEKSGCQYGIQIWTNRSGCISYLETISDISEDLRFTLMLAETCTECQIEPDQFPYVWEDNLIAFYSPFAKV